LEEWLVAVHQIIKELFIKIFELLGGTNVQAEMNPLIPFMKQMK
jgi:hypothetical protein